MFTATTTTSFLGESRKLLALTVNNKYYEASRIRDNVAPGLLNLPKVDGRLVMASQLVVELEETVAV